MCIVLYVSVCVGGGVWVCVCVGGCVCVRMYLDRWLGECVVCVPMCLVVCAYIDVAYR